jgi:hypothetical protein
MFLAKLVSVMGALDSKAFSRLSDYVNSPYFKVPAASKDLFEYLETLYPEFPEMKMKPEAIGKTGRNLSTRGKAARAGTDLLETIEHFIAMEDWRKQGLRVNWHRFNGLQQLDLLKQYEGEYNANYASIEEDSEQDIDIFFYRHVYTELHSTGFDALLNRTIHNDLAPTLKTLEEFYSVKLLRYMCEAVSRKKVLGVNYEEAPMDRVLAVLEPYANSRYPYPFLFMNVYRMLDADTFESGAPHYEVIKKFIDERSEANLPNSSIEAMSYAVSWCLFWVSRGYETPGKEYLWWAELKMKYGLLFENGKLMPITFRNIILSALFNAHKPDWVMRFIEQYSPYLPAAHRDTNVAFAMGLYYYRTEQYTKAIQSFLTAQAKEDIIFNAIIRRWQYMCTYDQNPSDTDLLINQLQSFEKYLLRNQEAFHQRKGVFSLFTTYAKKMLEIANKNKRLAVKKALAQEAFFPGKPWLLEKF